MEAGGARLIRYADKEAKISIWAISDIHYTNRGCDKELLASDIKMIQRDPYSLWTLLGDICDWIVPGDSRWDPECVEADLRVNDINRLGALVLRALMDRFKSIKDRCLGVGYGNHDIKYYNATQHIYLHENLCQYFQAPNLRYSGFVQLYFRHDPSLRGRRMVVSTPTLKDLRRPNLQKLTLYQIHGFGAASTAGGKLTSLKKVVDNVQADLIVMGHLHEHLSKAFLRLGVDPMGKRILERPTVAMMTGSYLRGYPSNCTSYSEMRGLPPATMGASKAIFVPMTGRLSVENIVHVR